MHSAPQESLLSERQAPPPQLWVPAWQVTPHEVPLQVAVPSGSPAHAEQLDPQLFTLLFETQLPPQLWKPPTQLDRKQVPSAVLQLPFPLANAMVQLVRAAPQMVSLFASQPPLKAWKPVLHVTVQVPACTLHVDVELLMRVQSTGGDPHAASTLGAHALVAESGWKPALQVVTLQTPLGVPALTEQTPAPLAKAVSQFLQPGPGPQQVWALTSHAVLPELGWNPWLQLATPQAPLAQVMVPCGSWCAASVQSTPAQSVVASDTQTPPSAWKPFLHEARTHAAGVVAVPAVQEPVPLAKASMQFVVVDPQAVSLSGSQALPFRWKPGAHCTAQLPSVHAATPPNGGAGQGVHDEPQLCGLVSEAHAPPQRCAPASHEVSTQLPAAELHTPLPPGNAVVQSAACAPQAMSLLSAQSAPAACCPAGQAHTLLAHKVDAQSAPVPQ
jgi:hypothetical protein